MKRDSVNFILNLASFFIFFAILATASVMIWVLPHGEGQGLRFRGARGAGEVNELLGLSRHEWGDVHLWLGAAFVALMVIHIILHWSRVRHYVKSIFGGEAKRS